MNTFRTLRSNVIAAALLAFIAVSVIAAAVLLGLDAPYAMALGIITIAIVMADDARIRRARRRSLVTT